jgi:predicted short-subunit dehydrogenase-like oxidoreductase (DUF2520 family)
MRIVIFGPGRVGRSFSAYARSLGHEAALLARGDAADAHVARADLVAAAIPDDALPGWFDQWRDALAGKRAIHFSGASVIKGLPGYHPLYSFPSDPLDPAEFARIAVAREAGAAAFAEILPGANNPEFAVRDEDRAFYHALAVVSGNFAAHLWNETAAAFAARVGPNAGEVMSAYFGSVVDRFRESPLSSLTGPVARRDAATVKANLEALEGEPRLLALYRAFLGSAWQDRPE